MNISNRILFLLIIGFLLGCVGPKNAVYTQKEREAIFNNYHQGDLSIGDTLVFHPLISQVDYDIHPNGFNGRKVIHRNHSMLKEITQSGSGKIYMNVCINRAGEPVFVGIDPKKTTITDRKTQEKALIMAGNYKYESSDQGALYECGYLKLFLEINRF